MGDYTCLFIQNSWKELKKIKSQLEINDGLQEIFKKHKEDFSSGNFSIYNYCRYLSPNGNGEFGVKTRNDLSGIAEMVIMADVYDPNFLMPSYAGIIDKKKDEFGLLYFVEHLGNLRDLKDYEWVGFMGREKPSGHIGLYCEYLEDLGYKLNMHDGRKVFGVLEEEVEKEGVELIKLPEYVMMDFCLTPIDNKRQIEKGIFEGKGKFKHLKDIWMEISQITL